VVMQTSFFSLAETEPVPALPNLPLLDTRTASSRPPVHCPSLRRTSLEENIMSDHHVEKPWFERYWQVGVIAFGIIFVLFWALYNPGV
jgi:hypothetical protein